MLEVLRADGHPTLRELADGTGLSRPTVEAALTRLARDGWVAALPPATGGVGRPARRYRFRAEARTVLGIEIGAQHVLALAADLDGTVGGERRAPVAPDADPQVRLDAAHGAALAALEAAGAEPAGLAAVTVGTPGVVGADGAVAVSVLPGWTGVALAEELGARLGCRVRAENDANLAVLGEHWRGAAAGARDAIFLLVAAEVGAGVLIDGRVHRGAHGAAGEVAHQDFMGALADYVTALALTIDPEVIVVGGAPDAALGPDLERALAASVVPRPRVVRSATGDRAVALGAVRHALDTAAQGLLG